MRITTLHLVSVLFVYAQISESDKCKTVVLVKGWAAMLVRVSSLDLLGSNKLCLTDTLAISGSQIPR
jgi:hypothetical protein